MIKTINSIYKNEISKIINDTKTEIVFLVGSSKRIDFNNKDAKVNDIDVFVLVKQGEKQVREIKEVDGVEFDINYFSYDGLKELIDNKEYFFLKEMKDPKIIYDKTKTGADIVNLCNQKFLEGPNVLSNEQKYFMKTDIKGKLDRLNKNHKIEKFEYEFLTNIYIKDIIIGYFIINNKWIPKDKNLLKELKKENLELFNLVKNVHENYKYEDLLNVYKYIFNDIKLNKIIKITY